MLLQKFLEQEFWLNYFNQISEKVIHDGPTFIILIVLLFVSLRLIKILIRRLNKILVHQISKSDNIHTQEGEKRINTLLGILTGTFKIIIWIIFLMILLKMLGLDIAPLLAGAGILGLAVGFGAQELVRDFISGFFILFDNQIRTGDYAIINGTGGNVEKIELRTVTLRDMAGTVHIFQNGKINSLSNMTKEWSAIVLEIGVAYKENFDVVSLLMQQVAESMIKEETYSSKILEPIEIFGLDKFADSAIMIKARIKTIPGDQWAIGREYRKRLKNVFDEKGIEIPFPHTTLYWGENQGLPETKK